MYQPPHFIEDRLDVLQAVIAGHPLGLLISQGGHGLSADPVPFLLDADRGRFGTLRAHIARANPLWQGQDPDREVLVVFQGPQHYTSPGWYATKAETHKVVPTWNYVMVQAYGHLKPIEDPAWLRQQIEDLTQSQEAHRPEPWQVSDAPTPFIEAQMRGIVGLEIAIDRLIGKVKVSQNRPKADINGVVSGLEAEGSEAALKMANWVRRDGQD